MNTSGALNVIVAIVMVVVVVLLGIAIVFFVKRSARKLVEQHRNIEKAVGEPVMIERRFPIEQEHERVIQGALATPVQAIRYVVSGNGWLFVQPTADAFVMTDFEDRGLVLLSVCAFTLQHMTPEIIIRSEAGIKCVVRALQTKIDNATLIPCEGVFQESQRLFADPAIALDVLSILSPEVLEVLQQPPYSADIYLKHNQLYYTYSSNDGAEIAVPKLMSHARKIISELEDNLGRWAAAPSNAEALNRITNTPLAETLAETWRRESQVITK